MAITPHSIIRLCNVPIDNTYKNQIYFGSKSEQTNYFLGKTVKTFSDYSYIRKDGKIGIRVDAHVDTLAICNYIMYQNSNYTNKYFYAFIVEMDYKNDNCTEIYFETDVYQSWRFEMNVLNSFVVREHPITDNIGDNIVPESFSFRDYRLINISDGLMNGQLTEWGYLVGTSDVPDRLSNTSRGKMMSGVYQGLYFWYYENPNNMNNFLDEIEKDAGDCVQFICLVPKFCVSANSVGSNEGDAANGEGWLYYSGTPAMEDLTENKPPYANSIDGYAPKNAKCFTSPFYCLQVTNNAGIVNEYAFEYWSSPDMHFTLYGDVSANPSVNLVPRNYNGINYNFDEGIPLAGFPQCSFNTDSFKLWLSRNQFSLGVSAVSNVAQIAAGAYALNPSLALNGAVGMVSQISDIAAHSKDPNRLHPGNTRNNLLTACGHNRYDFYLKHLRAEHIELVDDFFTMYGYRTDKVKTPNMSSRPFFNYVQTMDVNITGAIPDNDMRRLKQMFNDGVTFWKPSATVGDYSVNNSVWGGV